MLNDTILLKLACIYNNANYNRMQKISLIFFSKKPYGTFNLNKNIKNLNFPPYIFYAVFFSTMNPMSLVYSLKISYVTQNPLITMHINLKTKDIKYFCIAQGLYIFFLKFSKGS